MHKKGFLKGAAILGAAGIIVKLVGIFYRIPLANILGTEGAALYQTAYPYYTILLMISTAGLPPAISKLVSGHMAQVDKASANKVFRVSFVLLGILGLIASLLLFLFADTFAWLAKDPLSVVPIKVIAPAIFFVAVMASVRGYFQGLQNMFPTAMTQLVEQVVKVVLGLTLAYILVPKGIEYGAAGAILGVVISELIAMCVIIIYYFAKRDKVVPNIASEYSSKDILKRIIKLALPILIGASIMPLVTLSDSLIIRGRLQDIGYLLTIPKDFDGNMIADYANMHNLKHPFDSARSLFGIFSFNVNTLVNVPGTVSLAMSISILPLISYHFTRNEIKAVRENTRMGFKMAMLIGIPSAVGLGVLSEQIIKLLYGSLSPEQAELAGSLLAILAGGVIFLSILQTLNGILQGLGKVMVPVAALGTGAVVKVILSYTLIGIPEIGIYGAPISTFACYFVAAIIDIVMVKKLTGVKFGFVECVLRPSIASILMGGAAWLSHYLLVGVIGNAFATIIAVLVGIVVFALCIPIFKVLRRTEILGIPGGRKFVKIYDIFSKGEKDV